MRVQWHCYQAHSLHFLETETTSESPVLPIYGGDLGQLTHPPRMSHLKNSSTGFLISRVSSVFNIQHSVLVK